MKLRNKKTGEIVEGDDVLRLLASSKYNFPSFRSLAKLNEVWEDYKDDDLLKTIEWVDIGLECERLPLSVNDFNKKLKVLKRLKDKGFRFDGYDVANRGGDNVICGQIYFKAANYDREEIEDDLYLLFGDK